MQQVADVLSELHATIVAITPQLAGDSNSLIDQWGIGFDLLSDPGNAYATRLGLRFALPDDLREVYLSFGIDLAVSNGEGSWTLPMPGRLVIDTEAIVRTVDVDPDYQNRPEPQKTVDDVRFIDSSAEIGTLSRCPYRGNDVYGDRSSSGCRWKPAPQRRALADSDGSRSR